MKKLIQLLCILICIPTLICSCSSKKKYNTPGELIDYFLPEATEHLERADYIFLGRVNKISFDVIDDETELPATKDTPKERRIFSTLYEISVMTVYKGEPSSTITLRYGKGLQDYREEEQREILKEKKAKDYKKGLPIDIQDDLVRYFEEGRVHLFVVKQGRNFVRSLSWEGPIFSKSSEDIKKCYWYTGGMYGSNDDGILGKYEPYEPYRLRMGNYTIQEMITAFGEDKWNDFYARWEKGEFEPISVE